MKFVCIMIVPGNFHILFELSWQYGPYTLILSIGNIFSLFFSP